MTQKLEALHLEALCEEVRRQGRREGEREEEDAWRAAETCPEEPPFMCCAMCL